MLQKDIERFEIFGVDGKWLIKDNEQLPNLLDCYQSCVRLNKFAKRIAELEEQLKNAIVPKFKPYDNFYTINDINHIVCRGCIHIIIYNDRIAYVDTYGAEYECDFGKEMQQGLYTKEEAQAKLEELKGENK